MTPVEAKKGSEKRSPGRRTGSTRRKLIDIAERLFAEHGIEAVSLNQIVRESGERNASVLQYHLGSKKEVIEAIFERRIGAIDARRSELLNLVDFDHRPTALKQVATAMVLPFAEQVAKGHSGRNYVRFVGQLYSDPRVGFFQFLRDESHRGARRAEVIVTRILHGIPGDVVRHRLAIVTGMIIYSIANRETLRAAGRRSGVARLSNALFVTDLIDIVVAVLNAPHNQPANVAHSSSTER